MMTKPKFRGTEVVIVDDTESFALCVKSFLELKGFAEIELFVSSVAALEEVRQRGRPGFIITDLEMPFMTGDAFLEAARKIQPEVKGVIITALGTVPREIGSGFDVINKCEPQFFEKLLRILRAPGGTENALPSTSPFNGLTYPSSKPDSAELPFT